MSQHLQEIVDDAVRRIGKKRWVPFRLDAEDVSQEAWVAALEAEQAGVTDAEEIKRRVEVHLVRVISRELERPEIPFDPMYGDEEHDIVH